MDAKQSTVLSNKLSSKQFSLFVLLIKMSGVQFGGSAEFSDFTLSIMMSTIIELNLKAQLVG